VVPLGLVRDPTLRPVKRHTQPPKSLYLPQVLDPTLTALLSIPFVLFNSGSSPVGATAISFWSLLITQYAKYEAAKNPEGIVWRETHAGGAICAGTCDGVACERYGSTCPELKFVRPEGMPDSCQWFPVNKDLDTGQDYSNTVVLSNVASQLGCGLFLVFLGSLGDFGSMRWRGLALGACVLSFAPIVAAFISKTEDYAWQAVLLVAVVIAHLCAQQMFDAYLPLLAKSHPRSVAARAAREAGLKDAGLKDQRGPRASQHGGKGVKDEVKEKEEVDAEAPVDHDAKVSATRQEVASELAFFAPAMGFACMTLITLVQMAIIFRTNQQDAKDDLPRQEGDPNNVGRGLRLSIVIAGGWAMVCCWIGLRGLRIRPGRPLPFGRESQTTRWASMSKLGFRRTMMTVRMLRAQSPELLKLMLGQIFSTTGNGTVVTSYVVFVQRELNADNVDMVIIVLIGSFSACVGLLFLMPIAKRLQGKELFWMFMALKAVTLVWPTWMALGFTEKWEMFALVVIGGMLNPSLLPMIRSIFQQACPQGYEAAMFSLLGICTVAFIWIGSAVLAMFLTATGSMRWGILAQTFFTSIALWIFSSFDFKKAQEDRVRIESGEHEIDGVGEFDELRGEGDSREPSSRSLSLQDSPSR